LALAEKTITRPSPNKRSVARERPVDLQELARHFSFRTSDLNLARVPHSSGIVKRGAGWRKQYDSPGLASTAALATAFFIVPMRSIGAAAF